jgi:hypothetical protein
VNLTITDHAAKDFGTAARQQPGREHTPDPGAACGAIIDAEGDFHAINGDKVLCPLTYAHATARDGVYGGRSVDYIDITFRQRLHRGQQDRRRFRLLSRALLHTSSLRVRHIP